MIYKNARENFNSSIDCEILINGEWSPHTQDPLNEYELSEESEWPNIKLCDQAEKTAHEQAEARAGKLAELAALDVPAHTLARAIGGDPYAIKLVAESEVLKDAIRVGM